MALVTSWLWYCDRSDDVMMKGLRVSAGDPYGYSVHLQSTPRHQRVARAYIMKLHNEAFYGLMQRPNARR
jgi:hypothetical protein